MDSTETIYVVWQDERDGDFNIFLKKSSDYGETWSSDIKVTDTNLQSGWPRMAIDSNDVLHLLWLEEDETNPTYNFYPYDSDPKQIMYKNSADGGITWSSPITIASNMGQMQYCGLDICVGQADAVHVSYSKYPPSKVYHRRSTDGGTTWSTPVEIGSDQDAARPTVIAADSFGHVYVAFHSWGNIGDIDFVKSSDNGVTWGGSTTLLGGYGWPSRAHLSALDDGHVFLTYVSNKYGTDHWMDPREVYIIISNDYASTWGPEIRLTHTGFRMEHPITAIDLDNNINIVWQDLREGNWEIFYTQLDINGNTLVDDTRLTDDPAISGHPKIVIDSTGTRHVYWHDNRIADDNYELFTKGDAPQPEPPVAEAGPDQTVNEGDVVQFDGRGSYDSDVSWEISEVDTAGWGGGYSSLALDSNGYPHISYFDDPNNDLKYARWTGSAWSIEIVDSVGDVGRYSSIALDNKDKPSLSYYDTTNKDLKFARWTGTVWSIEIVDSAGWVGRYSSLGLDSVGYAHIAYYDDTNHDLKYGKQNGSAWDIETVDSIGKVGTFSSIVIDSNDYPHISYCNWTNVDLKYAKWIGSCWIIDTVDSFNVVGDGSSIALDNNDFAHISYQDWTLDAIKYAKWTGSSWSIEIVELDIGVSLTTSIALDSRNNPFISYRNFPGGNLHLRCAKRIGDNWSIETVDYGPTVGGYTSIELDRNDLIHISYNLYSNETLMYAKEGSNIKYEWDFNNYIDSDGDSNFTNDVCAIGPTPTHIYGDDGIFTVTLKVTDSQNLSDTDTCNVTVLNVDPTVTIEPISMNVEIGLRVAGRKYNDVGMTLYEDGIPIGYLSIERLPGSPDDQMAWIPISIDFSKSYSAIVTYIPEDPPDIGSNPVWIYLISENGSINKIHHTFNVQQSMKKNSEHWNHVEPWNVDLDEHFIGLPFEITTQVTDPGSDDETLTFSYGSQIVTRTFLNNPPNPDPYPSPDVNPRDIMDTIYLTYEGSGTLSLLVEDDDSGIDIVTLFIG